MRILWNRVAALIMFPALSTFMLVQMHVDPVIAVPTSVVTTAVPHPPKVEPLVKAHNHPVPSVVPLVSTDMMVKWSRVAWCETHGDWDHYGPKYDGGLGIEPINWIVYHGTDFAPAAHLATPEQQVAVAMRINGTYVPDQDGHCRNW